jgi:tetratricopeptide (TPR) repeat protein
VRILGPLGAVILGAGILLSLSAAYASRQPQAAPPEKLFLEVIVVDSPEKARHVMERLKNGEDFAKVAREESLDPTADAGGLMGEYAPNALRKELREGLTGVEAGQISPIVQIPSGYAIMKIIKRDGRNETTDSARNFSLASSGTVRYVTDVGGLLEADAVLVQFAKSPAWNHDPKNICRLREESLSDAIARMKQALATRFAPSTEEDDPYNAMETHYGLAQLYAYQGDMGLAIEQYQAAYQLALSYFPQAVPQMEESLGICYLHKSEMENDAYRAPGEKCLFPMPKKAAYGKPEDSKQAVQYFLKNLERNPNDLELKWLLNLSYMTMGKYPEGVPDKYLIPASAFESEENVGHFVDVASDAGLTSTSTAGGLIVDDFENNGLLDIVTSGFYSCAPMHYYHNNGDGTFTDRTQQAGLGGMVGGLNIVQADYNNDGCIDILVMRGGWEFPQTKSLLRNNCDGTFTDVTTSSGLDKIPTSSQTAVWVDINNDGLLDLFVGNENGPAELFLNKGDGTFQDIAVSAGVAGDGSAFAKGVAAADYDNDGYMDLYLSNLMGRNLLYHNKHDNTFTEVALQAGVPGGGRGFATWFFDYDNDGWPDLFVTSYFASVDESVRTYLNVPHNAGTLKLYKNNGDGTFRDVTEEVRLDKVYMPMGANFGDIDNDGFLDIYLGTGNPSYASILPHVLLRNHDGKYFVDVTTSSGTGELHKGHGVAFADLGNNGNEDIIEEIGGATPGDSHALRVFENPGHANDWITIKLVGVKTNRAGIGARVKVTVENDNVRRSIYRTVGSGGSFGASPLQLHVGLGKAAKIVSLEVDWPVSKTKQVFTGVQKNQFIEVQEFSDQYSHLERKSFHLGATNKSLASHSEPAAGTSPKTN